MKAINEKELRLGNLILGVYYTEDDEGEEIEHDDICEVLAINNGNHFANYSIYVDSKSDTEIFSSFHPIPLTEEWLVKLGAEITGVHVTYDRFLLIWKPEYKYWYVVCANTLAYMTKIEYVHEWQNFVYIMNNQELTIKTDESNQSNAN